MVIEWGEEYETGYPLIDKGHRGIIEITNRLERLQGSGDTAEVGQVLCDLTDCVLMHFGYEEMFMQRVHYPGYDAHMLSHCEFFATLTRFIYAFETNESGLAPELQGFLSSWLAGHESKEDKEFVDYLARFHPDSLGL